MGEVIGEVLTPAVGVMLSPLPIVGVILMLLSPKAKINGPAFVAGWIGGLVIVLAVVLLLADPADLQDTDEGMSTAAAVVHLALGILLILLALKQWQGRPKPGEIPEMPKWMQGIDKVTPLVALGLGALMSGLNPKNLIFDIAAATSIAQADLSTTDQIIASLVFIVVASVSVAGPVIWYLAAGESANAKLDAMKTWLQAHNAVIMMVLLFVLGASQLGKGIGGVFD
jgi:threonine/homoserine/homoserine lactone efflux protein